MQPKKSPEYDHVTKLNQIPAVYIIRTILWLFTFFISRSLLFAVGIGIVIPIFLITVTVADSGSPAIWTILFWIVFWPAALTGRTSIDENDFEFVFFCWSLLIAVVSYGVQKFFPSLRIPFWPVFVVITLLYIITGTIFMPQLQPSDRVAAAAFFIILYLACIGCLAISRALKLVLKRLSPNPPTK
jgi:hypothetical protein